MIEVKRTLAGEEKRFSCEVIERTPTSAVLAYVSAVPAEVAGIRLPAGTVTFGYFWVDRPYNVYHWQDPAGATLGVYFNLVAQTRITPSTVEWRDLVIDVLVTPDGSVRVLDEDELPRDLPAAVRDRVALGRAAVLAAPLALAAATEARSRTLRGTALGGRAP